MLKTPDSRQPDAAARIRDLRLRSPSTPAAKSAGEGNVVAAAADTVDVAATKAAHAQALPSFAPGLAKASRPVRAKKTQAPPPGLPFRTHARDLTKAQQQQVVAALGRLTHNDAALALAEQLKQAQGDLQAIAGIKQPALLRVVDPKSKSTKLWVYGRRMAQGQYVKFRLFIDLADPGAAHFGAREVREKRLKQAKYDRAKHRPDPNKAQRAQALKALNAEEAKIDARTAAIDDQVERGELNPPQEQALRLQLREQSKAQLAHRTKLLATFDAPPSVSEPVNIVDIMHEEQMLKQVRSPLQTQVTLIDPQGRRYLLSKPMYGDLQIFGGAQTISDGQRQALSRELLRSAAQQLAQAHQDRIVHRDIKPANFLFGEGGSIVLGDWADAAELGVTKMAAGTPNYLAPECVGVAEVAVDERTESFALGATVAEAALGRSLFDSGDRSALMQIFAPPLTPSGQRVDIPTLVAKRAQMSASAQDLVDKLGQWHALDPLLATYVVNALLHPDPAQRDSVAQAAVQAQRLQPAGSPGQAQALGLLEAAGQAALARQQQEVEIMRVYAEVFATIAPSP